MARPVAQRRSSVDRFTLARFRGAGERPQVSRSSVRLSTSPVAGILRFAWNAFTLLVVTLPYVPLTRPSNQPICFSRA
jgi:hypothetical protein